MATETSDITKTLSSTEITPNVKAKSKANKKSRKRKIDEIEVDEIDKTKADDATNPPKKKRKKKRGWSDEEELLFRKGLELYGRDWKRVAGHVGHERDAASIRSHCQIHFLRLLQNREPMPPKLLESGNGYTLSGKPLNKYSSIALRHFGSPDNVPMIDGVISDAESAPKPKAKKEKQASKPKVNKKKKKRAKYYDSDSDEEYTVTATAVADDTIKRRSGRKRTAIKYSEMDAPHMTNPFGLRTDIEVYDRMIAPNDTDAAATNNAPKRKYKEHHKIYAPFAIEFCGNALLVADIHAHLLRSVEIMGYLGGTYDTATRTLCIKKCYPLNEDEQGEDTVSANDLDILRVSQQIAKDELKLVGWYHSHPCFDNVPSNMDCHQHSIHKYPNEREQPYVGLIIQSLWNRDNSLSHWRWFNTNRLNGESAKDHQYMALQFEANEKLCRTMNDEGLLKEICALIDRYNDSRYDIYRTDFGENQINEKLIENITFHLKESGQNVEDETYKKLIEKIKGQFLKQRDRWWVTNKPPLSENNKENQNSLN